MRKEINDVQNRLWKVWLKEHDDKREDGENVEKREGGKGRKRVDKEINVGVELTKSETEYEERMFQFRKNRGFRKGSEKNREKEIQDGKIRDMK